LDHLPFLERYSGESTAELLALEGEYRVDSIVQAFETAIGQKSAVNGEGSLSGTELIVLAVESLEREVNNGGFDQFFRNLSAEYAPVVVSALEAIGCNRVARITEQALRSLNLQGMPTTSAVEAAMATDDQARSRTLGECDTRYFALPEDIAGALFAYIKAHHADVTLG